MKSLGADNTYGITSDPLTQFSCVFSAVIHDIDHPGVPNVTLVAEKTALAEKYNNKSIAEQNSVDLAWNLLMNDKYQILRSAIYSNEVEMQRFRQLVVNSVMATDIADKDQKVFRNARWESAFHKNLIESEHDSINRKATIVIEHLIQASDVSHTMQHVCDISLSFLSTDVRLTNCAFSIHCKWHIYRKWNQRFFEECYKAYKMGRADTDPSTNWYKGEIGFFDFYIIPLAKKLKDCGVFGVSSDEYLNYAIQNRNEWEHRGQEVVQEMVEHVSSLEYSTGVIELKVMKVKPSSNEVGSNKMCLTNASSVMPHIQQRSSFNVRKMPRKYSM
jgi:3'5'-cyclic nucleotide phosphodiesterase